MVIGPIMLQLVTVDSVCLCVCVNIEHFLADSHK